MATGPGPPLAAFPADAGPVACGRRRSRPRSLCQIGRSTRTGERQEAPDGRAAPPEGAVPPAAARRRPGPARPDPGVGVVLDGLGEEEVELLERLDGTLDEAAAAAWAARRGIPAHRVATLLATLRSHALTVDSPADRLDLARLPGRSGRPCGRTPTPSRAPTGTTTTGMPCWRAAPRAASSSRAAAPCLSCSPRPCGRRGWGGSWPARMPRTRGHRTPGRTSSCSPPPVPSSLRTPSRGWPPASHTWRWCCTGRAPRWAPSCVRGPARACAAWTSRAPTSTRHGPRCSPSSPRPPSAARPKPPGRPRWSSRQRAGRHGGPGRPRRAAPAPGRALEVGLPLPRLGERIWAAHPQCSCAPHATGSAPAASASARQGTMAG